MERSALGPRTSLLSLSWLLPLPIYPPPWISTFLSSHTCTYRLQHRSPHTQPDRLSRPCLLSLFHMDPHTSTYFVTLHLSIHVYSFRHSSPVHRSIRNQHTHTPLTISTPDPIHSPKPSHRRVPDLPLRLSLFMCNTVSYPHPFYLPPLLYPLSSPIFPFSSSTTSTLCTYLVHGYYTRTVHGAPTLGLHCVSSNQNLYRVYQWYMRLYLKWIIFSQWPSGRLYKFVLNPFQHLQCCFQITHFQRHPRVRE